VSANTLPFLGTGGPPMARRRSPKRPTRDGFKVAGLTNLIFLALTLLSLRSAFVYSRALATGEIPDEAFPQLLYAWMPAPADAVPEVANQLGADYMALYLPAKYLGGGDGIYSAALDPWRRPAYTYPPYTLWIYKATFARLNYVPSLLVHNWLQVALVAFAFFTVARKLALDSKRIATGVLFLFWACFLTAPGVLNYERGQSELYVLASFLLVIGGMFDHDWRFFLLAGVLASLKWSSYPFMFMCSGFYGLLHMRSTAVRMIRNLSLLWAVPILTSAPFIHPAVGFYVRLVMESEMTLNPVGVSQGLFLPKFVAKCTPFIALLLGSFLIQREKRRANPDLPFVQVLCITFALFVGQTYGTTCYEYRDMGLYSFILLGLWLARHRAGQRRTRIYCAGIALLAVYVGRPFASLRDLWILERPLLFIVFPMVVVVASLLAHRRDSSLASRIQSSATPV
jgi:hypothetical protein